jgi:hypothetical protein
MQQDKTAIKSKAIISGIITLLVPVADQLSNGALGPQGVIIGMAAGTVLQMLGRLIANQQITRLF